MKHLALLSVMDRDAVGLLLPELRDALQGGGPVTVVADAVEQIGLSGLQLVASAVKSAAASGIDLAVCDPSPAFLAAVDLAGLRPFILPTATA